MFCLFGHVSVTLNLIMLRLFSFYKVLNKKTYSNRQTTCAGSV